MAIISIFSSSYSNAGEVSKLVAEKTGYAQLSDELLKKVSSKYNIEESKLVQAMEGPTFLFNKFTHKREDYLAKIKLTLAEMLSDNQIVSGFPSLLIPYSVGHVLRVCILSDPEFRANELAKSKGMSIEQAKKKIQSEDQKRAQWTKRLFGTSPWDQTLYDIKIPTNETGVDKAVELIVENAQKDIMTFDEKNKAALNDFLISAKCEKALVSEGLLHSVSCNSGEVTVTVDEYTMLLEKLEESIKRITSKIEGVSSTVVKTGPNYRPTSVFANIDFELPEKILLVDDEKDFVMTLSERLEMRNMEPAIAYSGEEALNLMDEEEPNVMVLDLKMPGIDGIEVLKRVQTEHPNIRVIILTGHGSKKDRDLCMSLGAFAYLEKPVDIEVLSETMRKAQSSIKEKK